ncbi:hypothetical protein P7K49_003075 [Saguinus oedipus]|uniref:Uncharacterized protein n=1 Tax=Saguinus oedipus TaxID=9490 RepID=A0ABQ9WL44_SAGOE|nr:hypothetical protein P7K49_003075 [Saguinus oedipus]
MGEPQPCSSRLPTATPAPSPTPPPKTAGCEPGLSIHPWLPIDSPTPSTDPAPPNGASSSGKPQTEAFPSPGQDDPEPLLQPRIPLQRDTVAMRPQPSLTWVGTQPEAVLLFSTTPRHPVTPREYGGTSFPDPSWPHLWAQSWDLEDGDGPSCLLWPCG